MKFSTIITVTTASLLISCSLSAIIETKQLVQFIAKHNLVKNDGLKQQFTQLLDQRLAFINDCLAVPLENPSNISFFQSYLTTKVHPNNPSRETLKLYAICVNDLFNSFIGGKMQERSETCDIEDFKRVHKEEEIALWRLESEKNCHEVFLELLSNAAKSRRAPLRLTRTRKNSLIHAFTITELSQGVLSEPWI